MTTEKITAVLLLFLVIPAFFVVAFRLFKRRSPVTRSRFSVLFCLCVLVLFALFLYFGAIDFSGAGVFQGYGFSI